MRLLSTLKIEYEKYITMKSILFSAFLLLSGFPVIAGNILNVGQGREYSVLSEAIKNVKPGDTIIIHEGIYGGRVEAYKNLAGEPDKYITIKAAPGSNVIFRGGATFQLSDVSYLNICGLIFEKQTLNGFNLDDGGTFDTPSHHIRFENCTFRDLDASGNNDLLKMSGVDDFEIINCTFKNGSKGGSGIDMVGCHNGLIKRCHFEDMGSNAIQAKGGTRFICIEGNFFKNCGQRTLNLGGSTGLDFFRPNNATFEAADIQAYSNIIIGSDAAVAFVGSQRVVVANNTIINPQKWVVRILQETVNPRERFVKCGDNSFINNVIYRGNNISVDCNIGVDTNPESFIFSGNTWYNPGNPQWNGPEGIPVKETGRIIGKEHGLY